MSDFKMKVRTGESFPLTFEQARQIQFKMRGAGGSFPFVQMEDGSVIMLKHIVGFFADEFDTDKLVRKPEPKVAEPKAEVTEDSNDEEIEEKRKAALDEMLAKSSCTHENQTIYYQEVKTSTGKTSRRYFPVCDFCGLRMRLLKATALTDEQKDSAVEYTNE